MNFTKKMNECAICLDNKKEWVHFPCSHTACKDCYSKLILLTNKCPFCRHNFVNNKPSNIEEEEINIDLNDPDYWLEYDPKEWITFSRFLRNGKEIIRTFRKSEMPNGWRNDDMTTIVTRNKQRKRRRKIN